MKLTRTLVIATGLALAAGSALADTDKSKTDPGFNALDKNNDGYLTRTESARNPDLVKNFKTADKNGDGKLSRSEYLAVMTKKDLNTAKEKVTGKKEPSAGTGSSK
jgi:Ca2+-binding EF-hand superfamily protein